MKKIIKLIESKLPHLYNQDGEAIPKREIANKIIDAIPDVEKLMLNPFERWIPKACSTCYYNDAYKLGCSYEFFSEQKHEEEVPPKNCPWGY